MRKVPAGSETIARCASGLTSRGAAKTAPAWMAFDGSLEGVQQEPGLSSLCMLGVEFGGHNFRLWFTGSYHQFFQFITKHICLLSELLPGGEIDDLVGVSALVVEKIFVIPGAGFVGPRVCLRIRYTINPIGGANGASGHGFADLNQLLVGPLVACLFVSQERKQTPSLHRGGYFHAGRFQQCGRDMKVADD